MTRRHTKKTEQYDPYLNLASAIIVDAIMTASGQSLANAKDRTKARYWLRSKTCHRWAGVIGVDIRAAMNHKDSLVRLED
jgi:hypothetical protein